MLFRYYYDYYSKGTSITSDIDYMEEGLENGVGVNRPMCAIYNRQGRAGQGTHRLHVTYSLIEWTVYIKSMVPALTNPNPNFSS